MPFQPFHAEGDVDAWCARHALPKGAVLTMPALWGFASDWYGRHLEQPWRKRSLDETRALFARHGLTGDFWGVNDSGVLARRPREDSGVVYS